MMKKFAIVINSCLKYYSTTLPIIIEKLNLKEDVFCVVGESDVNYDCTYNEVKTFFRTWGNMDNNGLIWVVKHGKNELKNYEWIFYMHDTCIPLLNFFENIEQTIDTFGYNHDAIKLNNVSMSIGYYKLSKLWSVDVSEYILSTINYNKDSVSIKKIKNNVEDVIFNFIGTKCYNMGILPVTKEDEQNIYGTDTKRVIENWNYFLKMKANYKGTFEIIEL